MKKALSLILAAIFFASVLTSCASPGSPQTALDPKITLTSSDANDAAAWLVERLGSIPERVVIGTDAAEYGVDVSGLENDGYIIRNLGGKTALFARTADGLDRAVRKYAKSIEAIGAAADVTYHEGYRVKRIEIAGRDISEFTVYAENEPRMIAAANALASRVKQACGASLAVSTDEPDVPCIIMKYTTDEDLGNVGHIFNVSDNVVTIECSDAYKPTSASYAVSRFLEKTLGWMGLIFGFEDLPESDLVDIPAGFSFKESAAFEYASHCSSQHVLYESLQHQGGDYGVRMLSCHGMQGYRFAGELSVSGDHNWAGDQPCWLSDEFYEAAKEDIVEYLEKLKASGNVIGESFKFLDVAHGDNSNWCKCKDCQKMYIAEGTHAAEVLTWINKLSEELEDTYSGLYYGIFAYEMTKKPPKTIRPNKHIYITFCYDRSCSSHPLDGSRCTTMSNWGKDHDNPALCSQLETWLSFTKNIYVWYYGLHDVFTTMSFIHTVRDDIKYLHDVGVKGIYWEAHEAGFSANWVGYCLHSELIWNVDMSDEEYDAILDRLLRTFYGDAAEIMKEYIAELSVIYEHGPCVACWAALTEGGWRSTNLNDDLYAERFDALFDLIESAIVLADSFAEQRRLEMISCSCIYLGSLCSYPTAKAAGDEARIAELCERYALIAKRLEKYGMDLADKDTITSLWSFEYPSALEEIFPD